jgi:hypothetical protein
VALETRGRPGAAGARRCQRWASACRGQRQADERAVARPLKGATHDPDLPAPAFLLYGVLQRLPASHRQRGSGLLPSPAAQIERAGLIVTGSITAATGRAARAHAH